MITDAHPRQRPVIVTVAVVLWLALLGFQVIDTIVQQVRQVGSIGPWVIVALVIGLGITGLFVFGALRVGRGSGRARFWMAVLGAVAVLGVLAPPYGLRSVIGVVTGVAAVLPYLPAARAYFPPRRPRAPKADHQRVTGWDPDTGEPIRATD